ncbi:MAG: dinitrogenase iron-molybdenum cofactor biosynthesis protein [Desulfobacterales bacterium GWB2_56_26]|nr:MAG: dinitrogenase iron-molybdenum cofactor biosynthesis protein [Desulfobacterales bacterium GWB2_56_26]
MRVAIPTNNPGGLDADRSAHFGHCDVFTVIELDDKNKIESVATIANGGHEAGGCMVPVQLLSDSGVEAIVVGGLGARPMRGFADAGIAVYFADPNSVMSVRDVIDGFAANRLPVMHADQVCKGSGDCHH